MPRRRTYLERPAAHLSRAVAAHRASEAGVPHPSELAGEHQTETEPTPRQAAARRQSRSTGGKFK